MTERDELLALADEVAAIAYRYGSVNDTAVLFRAVNALRAAARTDADAGYGAGFEAIPKRPFAFAVKRAPENGADEWRLFMDECEARTEAEQLDGDYEGLYRVGDRRSAIAARPTPGGESVTVEEIARALERIINRRVLSDRVDGYTLEMSVDQAATLLSSFTITRKSQSEERS